MNRYSSKFLISFSISLFLAATLFSCSSGSVDSDKSSGPPSIHLIGSNPDTVVVGHDYNDPGATAKDDEDGDLSDEIITESDLDIDHIGSYEITYRVEDSEGYTDSVVRKIEVIPAEIVINKDEKPVLSILGKNPDSIMVGETWADSGATATDKEDGDLTDSIKVTGKVDTASSGLYELKYRVGDSFGNYAESIRSVRVMDKYDTLDISPNPGRVIEKLAHVFRIKSSHTVKGNLTLAEGETLIIGSKLKILNGTFLIEKGANLFFDENGHIEIGTSANIKIIGDLVDSVQLGNLSAGKNWGYGTSADYSGGIWIGDDAGTENIIQYAVFDSAKTAIYASRENGLTVKHTSFKNCKYQGINLDENTLTKLDSNEFVANEMYDVYTHASNVGTMTSENQILKGIAIYTSNVVSTSTWPALRYLVLNGVDFGTSESSNGQIVTIEAGAEFAFKENAYFEFQHDMSLNVAGTKIHPVRFYNADNGKYWGYGTSQDYTGGIWINDDAGTENSITYAEFDSAKTAIYTERENGLTVQNCVFNNNQYQGLILEENSLVKMDSATFSSNLMYDVYTVASNAQKITKNQKLDKGIAVRASNLIYSAVWPSLSYIALGSIKAGNQDSPINQVFTIEAGASFAFMEGAYIEMDHGMSIQVNGTVTNPIIFSNAETGKYWGYGTASDYSGGIWINSDAASSHSIEYAEFKMAKIGIYFDAAELEVTNSVFKDYKYAAIYMADGTLSASGNTYTGSSTAIGDVIQP